MTPLFPYKVVPVTKRPGSKSYHLDLETASAKKANAFGVYDIKAKVGGPIYDTEEEAKATSDLLNTAFARGREFQASVVRRALMIG